MQVDYVILMQKLSMRAEKLILMNFSKIVEENFNKRDYKCYGIHVIIRVNTSHVHKKGPELYLNNSEHRV